MSEIIYVSEKIKIEIILSIWFVFQHMHFIQIFENLKIFECIINESEEQFKEKIRIF